MIPIINDCEGIILDDTNVTTSKLADFDTSNLVAEKFTNVNSVKKLDKHNVITQ